jgi:hypothetical protein
MTQVFKSSSLTINEPPQASILCGLLTCRRSSQGEAHSSSDGQRFKVGGRAEGTGNINPKYGAEPGRLFYTHISDQYAPFSSKVVNVGVRDSTYVLDGLLHHESDLRIEVHYTDTAGFTALCTCWDFASLHASAILATRNCTSRRQSQILDPAANPILPFKFEAVPIAKFRCPRRHGDSSRSNRQ